MACSGTRRTSVKPSGRMTKKGYVPVKSYIATRRRKTS